MTTTDTTTGITDENSRTDGNSMVQQDTSTIPDYTAHQLMTVTAQRDDLRSQVERLTDRATGLADQLSTADAKAVAVTHDLANFKEQVVEVASRYADDNDWCSVVDQALEELGPERIPASYTATLEITVTFTADMAYGRQELPDRIWVRDSLRSGAIRGAIRDSFEMDSDHTSSSIDDIEFEVTDVDPT